MIYPPNQKPPIWSIDPGIIAYNCQRVGMPHPILAMPFWEGAGNKVVNYSGHSITCSLGAESSWINSGIRFNAIVGSGIFINESICDVEKKTIIFSARSETSNYNDVLFSVDGDGTYPFVIESYWNGDNHVLYMEDVHRSGAPISADDLIYQDYNNIAITYAGNKSSIKIYKNGISQN